MNELRVKGLDDIVPEMLRAVALRCDGRYAEALACYDRIRAINPRFIVCLVDQALLLAEMGRFENALDSIDEFRRHSPAISEVEDCRATIVDRAIAELSSSIDRRPGDSRLLTQRAGVYARCGELNLAQADFERAVAIYEKVGWGFGGWGWGNGCLCFGWVDAVGAWGVGGGGAWHHGWVR